MYCLCLCLFVLVISYYVHVVPLCNVYCNHAHRSVKNKINASQPRQTSPASPVQRPLVVEAVQIVPLPVGAVEEAVVAPVVQVVQAVVVEEVIPQSVVEVPSVILLHKNYHHSIKHPQDQSDLILTPRN